MFLNFCGRKTREKYLQCFICENGMRNIFYSLFFLLSGCYVITFSEEIASFNLENSTRVVHKNFFMRSYLVPGGYMFFVFLFPGYSCEQPIENAKIHIKVSSGSKVLLQVERNLKDLLFSRSSTGASCRPIAGFYEKNGEDPMSFELNSIYEKIVIEIYCECEKIKSMRIWLKDVSEIGSKKIWREVKEIEKKYR